MKDIGMYLFWAIALFLVLGNGNGKSSADVLTALGSQFSAGIKALQGRS